MNPMRAPRPCVVSGCPQLTRDGPRCPDHRRQAERQYDRQRGTAHERGYTARWAKYSKQYRKRHPLCEHCKERGDVSPAEHVDHIVPVSGPDDPGFWDPTNHQALCVPCHNAKTATEREGGGLQSLGDEAPKTGGQVEKGLYRSGVID